MNETVEAPKGGAIAQPPPVRIGRSFKNVSPAVVFKAWSSADHVKRWFAPGPYEAPQARVQMHEGGPFEVCMRSPSGEEHWTRGVFTEVVPNETLVIEMAVPGPNGDPLFSAHTVVTFAHEFGGTRLEVVQTYTIFDPMALAMVGGAAQGWSMTLDKLEAEVSRMTRAAPVVRSVVHATFHLERAYDAPVARVWKALTDEQAKSKWFGGSPGQWELLERHMDVRVGGREHVRGRWEGGVASTFDASYHEVIENERLVYTYEMHLDDKKISVSLATMQLKVEGGKTRLMVTEQGAFLDGYDDAGSREHGTGVLLDKIGASLTD